MSHRFVAIAQIVLSIVFIGGYFWVLSEFIQGNVKVPDGYKDAFLTVLGVLTAGVTGILAFWFARTRQTSGQSS